MAYEFFKRNACPLVYMFRVTFGMNTDQNQLMHSENSAKCRKRSQRMSLSFTWLEKYL